MNYLIWLERLKKIKRKILGNRMTRPVINYKKGSSGRFDKRALVTYTVRSFHLKANSPEWNMHSNQWEAIEIARTLNRLGYTVDFIDYQDYRWKPSQKYNLFLGMHNNFERLLPYLSPETIKIYYATGCHWSFENQAEQQRVIELRQRKGIQYPDLPIRVAPNRWVEQSDAVIVKGNEFTLSTYKDRNSKLFAIHSSSLSTYPIRFDERDWKKARRKFLWLAGVGFLHKGLDLLLEVFSELPELDIYLCAPIIDETNFVQVYHHELYETPNIHWLGWQDVHSPTFGGLALICGFMPFVSCSEGEPGSVLVGMQYGLIPIINRESAIDVKDFGIALPNVTVDAIRQAVLGAATLPIETCQEMSKNAVSEILNEQTHQAFSARLEVILNEIINSVEKINY